MTADQKIKDALALLRDPYSGFNQADFDGAIRTNIESLLLEHEEAFVRIAELEAWECRMLAQEEIDVAIA